MTDLLEGLNPAQREAVTHGDGPLLVLAGPGSGKTRVITRRVAHLIAERGVAADRILAVTFTNKAADEMRRRIAQLSPEPADEWAPRSTPTVATFHKLCARLLRQYGQHAGLSPGYSILDQQEAATLVTRIVREQNVDPTHVPPDSIAKQVSKLKSDLVSPEAFAERADDVFERYVAKIYPLYEARLREQNAVDFDDLLFLTAQLLREHPDVRRRLDSRYLHVLVDEYQDTNLAQYAIARALSVDHPNLCATGDPDQSIYGWRGANLENILRFEDDFPGSHVVRLETNYRSTGHILAVADQLIRFNAMRREKGLVSSKPDGELVCVRRFKDDQSEARHVAERIRQAVDEGSRAFRDFAIFVRVSSLTRPFEQAFRGLHVPYQVVGGYSFFERKEVRDVVAYARLVVNPSDDAAFARIVNKPPRGIGKTTLERLAAHARSIGASMSEACRDPASVPGVRGKQLTALRDFRLLLDELSGIDALSPPDALETIVELAEYREYLDQGDDEERQERQGALEEMIGGAANFAMERPDADLIEFLESISLIGDGDQRDDRSDVATIMTLHAAKGLEFPVVYMVAFEHDILPHERAEREGNLEEERRLVFVGFTRAMEELNVSYTARRFYRGSTTIPSPSPFLAELPRESLLREDVMGVESVDDDDGHSHGDFYEEPSVQVSHGASAPSVADQFRLGMRVQHPRYGPGQILQVEGMGDDKKATIHFSSVGTKRFVLAKSPLQPIC